MSVRRIQPERRPLLEQVLPKLRPFQREALEFATEGRKHERQFASLINMDDSTRAFTDQSLLGKGRILLADEMGLGKTLTSLAIMAYYEPEWPLLILCPASLRYTWPAEIEKFLPSIPPQSIYVASGFQDIGFTKRKDIKVVIITYSLLQNRSAISHVLEDQNYNCIIADESHNLKHKDSQRCKFILPVMRRARRLVLLSGTPCLARPVELWSQISCLAPKLVGNYSTYTKRYCNPKRKQFGGGRVIWDYSGSSHEAELHAKLKNIMVRRLKSDVLHELPPKQRSIVPVSISRSENENCKRVMAELGDKRAAVETLVGDAAQQADFEAKSKLTQAYQASGIGKAQAVIDYLMDWLAGSESQKILVFGHHKAVLDAIDQHLLAKLPNSHIRIDGSVPTNVRAQLVRKFQTCARVRVGLLGMTAAGVGLTLTAASTVLFAELHWTPGVLAQAEDRAHRIGQQHDSVQVIYMVCKDSSLSIDMSLWKLLGRKIGTLGQVVDGKEDAPYIYAAQESPGTKLPPTPKGQSVQDELTSFFAETSTTEARKKKKSPVKGSIQSFFKKAAAKKASPSSDETKTVAPNVTAVVSRPPSRESDSSAKSKASKGSKTEITWCCDTCTLINTRARSSEEWLPCEMCGNLYNPESAHGSEESIAPNKAPVPRSASPVAAANNDKVEWECKNCTYENARQTSASGWYPCEMCGEPREIDNSDSDLDDDLLTPVFGRKQPTSSVTWSSSTVARKALHRPARVSMNSKVIVLDTDESDKATPKIAPNDKGQKSLGKKAHIDVVEIDIDEPRTVSAKKGDSNVIVIDDDVTAEESSTSLVSSKYPTLKFSVSKNTGRIQIHYADTGATSLVNFDIQDVVTDKTADSLLDARVKKVSGQAKSIPVEFNGSAVGRVIGRMTLSDGVNEEMEDTYEKELKEFVTNFLGLREIEKKALKDSGEAFAACGLSQAAGALMTRSLGGTERYAGGAKERARENADMGNATDRDLAVLDGKACAWCGRRLSAASRTAGVVYCTQECAEEGRLRRGGMYSSVQIRAAVFALERGKCTICGIDGHALFEQISALEPAERLNKLLAVNWSLPKSAKAMESLLQDPKEGDFWQVDHIRAVAEGGGSCGLENLRTLCVPCHQKETEKLRARLKLRSPPKKDGEETGKRKQVDIRSAFFGANAGKRPRK